MAIRAQNNSNQGFVQPTKGVCAFCMSKIKIDYKNVDLLRGFLSDWGTILPRRQTGTCARHQRQLARAIKRARYLALLPHAPKHIYRYG